MRFNGFALVVVLCAGSTVWAQPGAPVAGQPPVAQPEPKPDPKLDPHLAEWEKKMANATNMRTEIKLERTDAVFKKAINFSGTALCMKPGYARLRLDNAGDATRADYEAYICDGKAVFAYNGLAKTVTVFKLPKTDSGADNLMIDFLSGMKARDVKTRFNISLNKVDANYVYLDIKPRLGKDQREFTSLQLALYGPGADTAKVSYLPAQVRVFKPNGDTEVWSFKKTELDVPGIDEKLFRYEEIKGWKVQEAPPAPESNGGKR
ncbi:Outer membrane lipoprotein carrier protein LolA OS=Isosphaera pallida (strain ATCC 43644 / DSM 9630 / IS1B) GN=Isop_0586 PE=4 SV=1 [Gemmata massiliana]|uniref:Outer membrane lipoprotein carrier protein LolA n=1 Tax=Gemmata massiliana TaxID=1210884 RepID=A0A6P2DGW7_9BACT|nr:TIGR03009 domain-containing protein [Gemmata massiliana]VTS01065.1 Outer membrane lipoprotein carrier protein LolA OS=Isosphaera pallida (strain ATCC 43644 / DSM 9630 / IS1B) GN=Isop_0586 PE=4 SV=1 [Gemmata massiliana]